MSTRIISYDGVAFRQTPISELDIRHPRHDSLKLMTIAAYFDGSGKSHDRNTKWIALAGYVGTEDAWKEFEKLWGEFKREHSVDYFHSSELHAGHGHYKQYGRYKVAMLTAGLIELIRNFDQKDFCAIAYAISMNDYRMSGRQDLPSPEFMCGSECLKDLSAIVPPEQELQVFYDRGESFLTDLQNKWRDKKERLRNARLNRINVFSQVDDWRKYPALQAADYLVHCIIREDFQMSLAMLTAKLPFCGARYDKQDLMSWHY